MPLIPRVSRYPSAADAKTLPVDNKTVFDLEGGAGKVGCAGRCGGGIEHLKWTARNDGAESDDFAAAHIYGHLRFIGFVGGHYMAAIGKGIAQFCHIPLAGFAGGKYEGRVDAGLGLERIGCEVRGKYHQDQQGEKIFERCHWKKKLNC